MPKKSEKPDRFYKKTFVTKGGGERMLYPVRLKDRKGVRRDLPAGDNWDTAVKLRGIRLAQKHPTL